MRKSFIFTLTCVFLSCVSGYADIYINEVNSTGKWIEIYNSGSSEVNVGGYMVTRNNNDNTVKAAKIPAGTTISAKGFLVIYEGVKSGGTSSSPVAGAIDCMEFGISSDKFMSAILKDDKGFTVDVFDIKNPQTVTVSEGKSWARATDGAATIDALEPTPGKSNTSSQLYSDLKIYINEVNSAGKWIEIYNDETYSIHLGRYTIIRNNNEGSTAISTIPPGTYIEPKGFLVLYQNGVKSPVEDAIECLSYGISSDKFMSVVLKDGDGAIVDKTFDIGNPQELTICGEKTSWARVTDGAATIDAIYPNPGKPNTTLPSYSDLKIFVNEVNSDGKWIELYNDENENIDVGGYTLTRNNNDCATSEATIPAGTIIASKGFLVLYQEEGDSPFEDAIECLPYGISATKFMSATLKDGDGAIVDETFDIGNPQNVTVSGVKSWARIPDGAKGIVALDPTPGLTNGVPNGLISEKSENTLAYVHAGTLILPEGTSYIQLYSASGSLVLERGTATSIDLTNLPKGFYVVKMTVSGKLFVQKIVL